MTIKHYTSLETSRLIHERVPEVMTDTVWVDVFPLFNNSLRIDSKKDFEAHLNTTILSEEAKKLIPWVFAYRLDDVMRAVKVLGEKEGWETIPADAYDNGEDPGSFIESHRIFYAFLSDGCEFGEKTEGLIKDIFTS